MWKKFKKFMGSFLPGKQRLGNRARRLLAVRRLLDLEVLEDRTAPAVLTWLGPDPKGPNPTDFNWKTPGNWQMGGNRAINIPGNMDTLVFNGTSTSDSTDNIANLSLAELDIENNYGATITLQQDLKVGIGHMYSGTVTGVDLIIAGGAVDKQSFTFTNGTMEGTGKTEVLSNAVMNINTTAPNTGRVLSRLPALQETFIIP